MIGALATIFRFALHRNRQAGPDARSSQFEIESARAKQGGEMIDRRGFLSSMAGVATLSASSFPEICNDLLGQAPASLPDHTLYDKDEESYWSELRKQFLIPEDEVYLNNGTVGSSPAPVLRAVFEGYRDAERLAQIRRVEPIPRPADGIRRRHAR
jgi:hypothetical protein